MIHGPSEHGIRCGDIAGVEILECQKRNDALGHAVDVDRVVSIMEVLRSRVRPKKMLSIEFESTPDVGIKFGCFKATLNRLQATQIVSRVEVINPVLGG